MGGKISNVATIPFEGRHFITDCFLGIGYFFSDQVAKSLKLFPTSSENNSMYSSIVLNSSDMAIMGALYQHVQAMKKCYFDKSFFILRSEYPNSNINKRKLVLFAQKFVTISLWQNQKPNPPVKV